MKNQISKLFLFLFLITSQINFAQDYKDCGAAYKLCGESPFNIETTSGFGLIDIGIDTTCLLGEYNSIWITWTVIQEGLLTFNLKPNDETQDLDFIVFKFNIEDDCEYKELIRCMASGENAGSPPEEWEICTGPTGLLIGETDIVEYAGCSSTDNNYLAPIETNQGDQYVMLVNEFSGNEAGFELSFGGSTVLDCITVPITELKVSSISEFEIIPSLSNGLIKIKLANEYLLRGQLFIHNMNGQMAYSNNEIKHLESDVDLTMLPKGIYISRIQKGNSVITKKFLIVN